MLLCDIVAITYYRSSITLLELSWTGSWSVTGHHSPNFNSYPLIANLMTYFDKCILLRFIHRLYFSWFYFLLIIKEIIITWSYVTPAPRNNITIYFALFDQSLAGWRGYRWDFNICFSISFFAMLHHYEVFRAWCLWPPYTHGRTCN